MFAEIASFSKVGLPFVLTTVGDALPQPPVERTQGLHSHQFIWVTEGSGAFYVSGARLELGVGEGIFMREGLPHRYEGAEFCTAWCTFQMDPHVLDHLGVGEYLIFTVPQELNRKNAELHRFASGESTLLTRSAAGYAHVMELFAHILSEKETLSARVYAVLERRCSELLSLDDIAAEVGVDRFALCRAYKKERGVTVMEELNAIRIAKAKRLLKYSGDSVEAIGKACGFSGPSYFGKRFREAVGCSPAVYRK